MKRKFLTKGLALTSAAALTLTGCGSFVSEDVASYPLAPMLTQAEIIDYYAKALEYDSIISRDIDVHEAQYVTRDITGEKAEMLKELVSKAEDILASNEYEVSEENVKVVSPDTYEYIKGLLDNEVISNGQLQSITGALGYYFVDVEYDIGPSQIGKFKQTANLVGLHGALYEDLATGEWKIDTAYIETIVNKMNDYYRENLIFKELKFDPVTFELTMETGHLPEDNKLDLGTDLIFNEADEDEGLTDGFDDDYSLGNETSIEADAAGVDGTDIDTFEEYVALDDLTDAATDDDEDIDAEDETTDEVDEATDGETTDGENTDSTDAEGETTDEVTDEVTDETTDTSVVDDGSMITGGTSVTVYNSITSADRKVQLDVNKINEVVGQALSNTSEMPSLETVYESADTSGSISGYGISNAGGDGLKVFNFNRDNLTGKLTMRYVFKDDPTGTGELLGRNIYIMDEDITTGISTVENNVLIPDFLMTQFSKLLERADRLQVDYDLASLMSGNVYEDMGIGLLRGYKNNGTNILKYMSTIRQVINRDTANNSYVLEVETTTIEGARDVDSYGTYRDKSYVVVQQQGTDFKIIDWCRISRDVVSEAPIDPDSTTLKRLVALNLAGEIPEDSKKNITTLLTNLYTAGTNRILHGPQDIQNGDNTVTIEKGLYDCFQTDTNILSEEKYEYMNSSLRNQLIRKGTEVTSRYGGVVTEWIGGYEDQAELTTEELIIYDGTGEAYYMQVYYLVSNLNDVWVIDERTVLDEYMIDEPNTISNIAQRVCLQYN